VLPDDKELDALISRIANKALREKIKQLPVEHGLTAQDHEMFRRCLRAYAETDKLLAETREQMREGKHESDRSAIQSRPKRSKGKNQPESLSAIQSILSNLEL